jgi:hypothetical protein
LDGRYDSDTRPACRPRCERPWDRPAGAREEAPQRLTALRIARWRPGGPEVTTRRP